MKENEPVKFYDTETAARDPRYSSGGLDSLSREISSPPLCTDLYTPRFVNKFQRPRDSPRRVDCCVVFDPRV